MSSIPVYSYVQIVDTIHLKELKSTFREDSEDAKFVSDLVNNMTIPVNFDLILSPASSSLLLNYFVSLLSKKYKKKTISNAFVKSLPEEISFCTGDVILDEVTLRKMLTIIDNAKRSGIFELKKVKPIYLRKFFINLMRPTVEISLIADKKLLLVDDIITSGSTMNDMFKTLMRYGADDVVGLTLLKRQ